MAAAYKIYDLDVDKKVQDPYTEGKQNNSGPHDTSGTGAEDQTVGFYAGDLSNISIIITEVLNSAGVGKIYGCNDFELHATDPLANNRLTQLGADIVIPANAAAPWIGGGGYALGNWKWILVTIAKTAAGAGAGHMYIDIHGNNR